MKKNPVMIVKFGGSIAQVPRARALFLKDLAARSKKEKIVLLHGGGPEINLWLQRLQLKSVFVNGLRYTDAPVLEVVEMVLSGKVNKGLVGELNRRGVRAVGLSGKDGKTALCTRVKELGFVGEPSKIDASLVSSLLDGGFVPVISSLGFDAKGQTLNVNADSMAMALAGALKADALVLLTDVPGVLDAQKKTIPEIRVKDIQRLFDSGVISGGMIPKLKACAHALKAGIKEVWIIEGSKGFKHFKGTVIRA